MGKNIQIFEHMQNPLISTAKVLTNRCNTFFESLNTHILTGKTKQAVHNIIWRAADDNSNNILMTVPFDNATLMWKITDKPDSQVPTNVVNNVHLIRSNAVLLDYLHQAAGYPVKKTWLQAIKAGLYATWPGVTYNLVAKHLPEVTKEVSAGHLYQKQQGI